MDKVVHSYEWKNESGHYKAECCGIFFNYTDNYDEAVSQEMCQEIIRLAERNKKLEAVALAAAKIQFYHLNQSHTEDYNALQAALKDLT